jgi:hypothetical protein
MCELLVVRYRSCQHVDHLPGKLHDMPIYCANLEFMETGTSTTHDVCITCRPSSAGRAGDSVVETEAKDGAAAAGEDDKDGKQEKKAPEKK